MDLNDECLFPEDLVTNFETEFYNRGLLDNPINDLKKTKEQSLPMQPHYSYKIREAGFTLQLEKPLAFQNSFEDKVIDSLSIPKSTDGKTSSKRRKHTSLNDGSNICSDKDCNQILHNKKRDRSSIYRGVCRYSGRFEAFLWDNTDPGQKAKTVYVGAFDLEEAAARAYDLAALKFWGTSTNLNFPLSDYANDLEEMKCMTKKEYVVAIRRMSQGFAKGASNYRGVSRKKSDANSDYNKWQARLGKGKHLKGLYLGTFDTEEEAARAYDVASIRLKGVKAVTNFGIHQYDIQSILQSQLLPIGKGASKFLTKNSVEEVLEKKRNTDRYQSFDTLSQVKSSNCFNPYMIQLQFPKLQNLRALTSDQDVEVQQDCNMSRQVIQPQNPSSTISSLHENPSFLYNWDNEPRRGLEGNENVSYCEGFGYKGILEGNSLDDDDKVLSGIEEMESCISFQTLLGIDNQNYHQIHDHQNVLFGANQQFQQNPSSYLFHGLQNPNKFQTNSSSFNGFLAAGIGVELNGNENEYNIEFPSGGTLEEKSTTMEVGNNSCGGSNSFSSFE